MWKSSYSMRNDRQTHTQNTPNNEDMSVVCGTAVAY